MDDEIIQEPSEVPAPDPVLVPAPSPPLEGPLAPDGWRELGDVLWLSFPIIITMFSYAVMNFADMVMVGRHSKAELAAVTPAGSCFFLLASLMMGTLSITNTFVSQSVGRGRKRDAPHYVWHGIYLGLIWGVVALAAWPWAPRLFAWAGHAEDVQALEVDYFRYLLFRMPALGSWLALAAFYQATKRPVVPMVAALIGSAFNVLANYTLIYGAWGFPEMGIKGAAIATVAASYFQAFLMLVAFLSRPTHREFGSRSAWRFDAGRLWRMIRFGLPAGIGWCIGETCFTLFFLKIIGALGGDALAANNATFQIIHLSFMPVIGLNIGVQAVVGHHIGMGDYDGAKRRAYWATGLAVCFMVATGVIFVVFRGWLIGRFLSQKELARQAVVALGSTMLIFAAVFQAFNAVAIISHGALKGAGDTKFPMYASIICPWSVFLPMAWYLTQVCDMGIVGAWLPMPVYIAILALVNFWRFASNAWRKIDIFKGQRIED